MINDFDKTLEIIKDEYSNTPEFLPRLNAIDMAIKAVKSKSFRCEYCKYCDYIGSDKWVCCKKHDQVARNGICNEYIFDEEYYQ